MTVPRVDLTIDAQNSCNWKCCLWCKHRPKSPVREISQPSSADVLDDETIQKVSWVFEKNVSVIEHKSKKK